MNDQRTKLRFHPLRERENRVRVSPDFVGPADAPDEMPEGTHAVIAETARRLREARERGAARMISFGAHAIKNGLGPVLIRLMEEGWLTHLATNGAGIIHDWEFAYLGESSEHVERNVARGEFGMWEETGRYINMAIACGAWSGLGYGESIGKMIDTELLRVPSIHDLKEFIVNDGTAHPERLAATAELLELESRTTIEPGELNIPHPHKAISVQAAAFRLGLPCTGHPMIGHDIIYLHPANHCALLGRAAERDFLRFARSVSDLSGGVYMSIGSAVMSPMIFEKSMSMAQNLALQEGRRIEGHFIVVADLAKAGWDWSKGEPPEDHPDYYLRFNKTFARMGGELRYVSCDNRDFLLALYRELKGAS